MTAAGTFGPDIRSRAEVQKLRHRRGAQSVVDCVPTGAAIGALECTIVGAGVKGAGRDWIYNQAPCHGGGREAHCMIPKKLDGII